MHTNNSTQHTPTPWEVHHRSNGSVWITSDGHTIYDSESPDVWPLRPANAAFIVRACNAHDELVAALEGTIDCLTAHELDCARDGLKNASSAARDALSAVRAVLAKL